MMAWPGVTHSVNSNTTTLVAVTTGAIRSAKLQLNRRHQQTNTRLLQAGWPSCRRPTNSVKDHSVNSREYCDISAISAYTAKQTESLSPPTYFRQIIVLVLNLEFLMKITSNYTILSQFCQNLVTLRHSCAYTCQMKWIVLMHTVSIHLLL